MACKLWTGIPAFRWGKPLPSSGRAGGGGGLHHKDAGRDSRNLRTCRAFGVCICSASCRDRSAQHRPSRLMGARNRVTLAKTRPHTGCLGLAAVLCALSIFVGMPVLVSVLCLSAVLYGWDLALMELRTAARPRDTTFRLERRYAIRCLRLAGLGFGATLLARIVHVRMSFLSAFAISCWCMLLFLVVHRRVRTLMLEGPSVKEEADS